jgi:hypothetical protein
MAASMVAGSARVPVDEAAADGGPQPCPAGWLRPRGLQLPPNAYGPIYGPRYSPGYPPDYLPGFWYGD